MLIKLEVNYNKKFLSSSFSKIDSDHSGYIEPEEFFNFVLKDPY